MHTLTLNEPIHTRAMIRTTWAVRWSCRLGSGFDNVGLRKSSLKLCATLRFMGTLGTAEDVENCRELLVDQRGDE